LGYLCRGGDVPLATSRATLRIVAIIQVLRSH
jgi:hypothetical protein